MANTALFSEGINAMFIAKGLAVVFLLAFIYIRLISPFIKKYFTQTVEPLAQPTPTNKITEKIEEAKETEEDSDELEKLRPIIVAAIAHHRKINRK